MLRGCVPALLLLAGLVCGYYYWLDQVFEPPGGIIGGGVAGLLVFLCVGGFWGSFLAWRDWSRLSAVRFQTDLLDGESVTVSGTIEPVGQPLLAPFSQTPCVVCEYDITSQQRMAAARAQDNSNSGSDYAGFLMVPCVIRTANGDVRLLGFPIVEGFEEEPCYSYTAARNAREFLRTTEFEDRTGLMVVSVLTVFGEVWADDDGFVQKNMRLGKVAMTDLFQPQFDQQLERLANA